MGVETMMMAAAVASAAGTAAEGIDGFRQSRYRASSLRNQADAARADAGIQTQLQLEESARDMGAAVAGAARDGGLGGSAWDVLADLSRQQSYETRRIATEGANAGRALDVDAKQVKRQGTIQLGVSLLKAGAQLAGAPNAAGDGTLLSDAMAKRATRSAGQRIATSAAPVRSWGARDAAWSGGGWG